MRGSKHDLHLAVAAEKPVVIRIRQVIDWTIEITIVVIVTIQELVDVIGSAHGNAMGHDIGVFQRKVHGLVSTEAASGHGQFWRLVLPAHERKKFVKNIALKL